MIPGDPEYAYFQDLISELSEQADSPKFSPHITLLGQLPQDFEHIKLEVNKLCNGLEALQLSFSHLGMFEQYFRSIILHTHPSQSLEDLHQRIRDILAPEENAPFVPHLSLLYSHLELNQKRLLMEGITLDLPIVVRINTIVITRTDGNPSQWQEAYKISLK